MALKISSSLGLDQNIPNKSIFELCFSSIRFNCIYVYPVQEITQEKGAGCFFVVANDIFFGLLTVNLHHQSRAGTISSKFS